MARPLRIEYPGAIYHVMNRGDRREPIFRDDEDHTYSYTYFTVAAPYNGSDPGDYWVFDVTTGEESAQNKSDPRDWFTPTVPLRLGISTSRWAHTLVLQQPDGSEYPVVQHVTQGDVSLDASGQAWFNSYYDFDAATSWRSFVDFWVVDQSTGEGGKVWGRGLENCIFEAQQLASLYVRAFVGLALPKPAHRARKG
jgi:hypothetical protein